MDIIERVLGGVRDSTPAVHSTPLFDVDVPWYEGSIHSTVEMTVGLPEQSRPTGRRNRD